ncbi:MAG: 16S rRNA (cytidine(1402)-2'-O)-methyltransferase [Spirochaetota bacterium]
MNKPTLYVVATPIGNMEDITLRALRILKEGVSAIFCEDTRQTKKILSHYAIQLPAYPLHSHSSAGAVDKAISILAGGESIAYVTDCGTPSVSDPGSRLVAAAREAGYAVSPLPGASALTALASVSGFAGKSIVFGGFLSKKEGRRRRELADLGKISAIIIFYESPHRIKKTIQSIEAVFPGKNIIMGREMTKMFEEFISGTTSELAQNPGLIREKGEFAIAIDNTSPDDIDNSADYCDNEECEEN